ncbi:actin-related protein 6-like [Lineus longissimus]|uniref:actin-related protein 6-like n=1 Tax=Lineus longissimus TaxID=88925 RepID=UPI002B4F79A3
MGTFVLDNGAGLAKAGYSTDSEPKQMVNCVTKAKHIRSRVFVGDQIDDCKDLSGIFYLLPFQKGYLTNWEIQQQVWNHIFGTDRYKVRFDDTTIIVTEPYFNFLSIQETMNEVLFEEYQFKAAHRTNAACLSWYKSKKEERAQNLCALIVDSGYSFTHIVPFYNGKKIKGSMRRINVGGKMLTNHLKEIISYRQLMVMDESHVMNQCKEDVCFVSTDFKQDMAIAASKGRQNSIARDYVLPDYTHIKRGFVRSIDESSGKAKGSEQIIRMNNERFQVAEILFHPSDVGVSEMGVSEAIVHSINSTPSDMHPHLYKNIVLTGGCCNLPGFRERVYNDLRSMACDDFDVNVRLSEKPGTYAWEGGGVLSKTQDFSKKIVTRQQYEEYGQNICLEKFDV